ncbi:MAG: TonB-dependent receptor, partial [Phenylobacterium sp.]|nr:TonB-dependent receptor [Phenylobacterium sp.]
AVNLYASYSKGFKSGAFSANSPTVPAVDPEKIDAFEVGAKSLFSDRLRITTAVFLYNYKDIQVLAYGTGSTSTSFLQNAARARITGAEFEAVASLGGGFDGRASATYTHGTYTSFPSAAVTIPRAVGGGNDNARVDVTGNAIVRTPEWTLGGALGYKTPMFGGTAGANLNVFWSSAVYWDALNRIRQPSYAVANLSVSWTDPSEKYKVTGFVNNIFDQAYAASILTSANSDTINYAEPRWVGVRLDWTIR